MSKPVVPTVLVTILALAMLVSFQNCALDGRPSNAEDVLNSSQSAVACTYGQIESQGSCHSRFISCVTDTGQPGQQEFISGFYGACSALNCPSDYHVENAVCTANKRACSIANGVGEQTWSTSAYGACTALSCQSEYVLAAGGAACAGPAQAIYRYKAPPTMGLFQIVYLWWSFSATDPNGTLANRSLEGVQFSLYKNSDANRTPVYFCSSVATNAYSYLNTNATCNAGYTPSLLGYGANASEPAGASRPLYKCGTSFLLVTNTAECGSATPAPLLYVF